MAHIVKRIVQAQSSALLNKLHNEGDNDMLK